MAAVRLPAPALIAALPTAVLVVAVLLPALVPLTTETFSLLTKPLMVCVKLGLAAPYRRD